MNKEDNVIWPFLRLTVVVIVICVIGYTHGYLYSFDADEVEEASYRGAKRAYQEQRQQEQRERLAIAMQMAREDLKNAKVGGYARFGAYPYSTSGKMALIEWHVISKKGNCLLLITADAIDYKPMYDDKDYKFVPGRDVMSWHMSSMRRWLNEDFYNLAFIEDDAKLIETTIVEEEVNGSLENPDKSTLVSKDKVFLIGVDALNNYYHNVNNRLTLPTPYAKKLGARGEWWLRTTVGDANFAFVDANFHCVPQGKYFGEMCGVAPAIWINPNGATQDFHQSDAKEEKFEDVIASPAAARASNSVSGEALPSSLREQTPRK